MVRQILHLGKSTFYYSAETRLRNVNTSQGSSTGKTTLRTKDLTCHINFTKTKQHSVELHLETQIARLLNFRKYI